MTCNCGQNYVICISEEGFEDQITHGIHYDVVKYGMNSYFIENDRGEQKWYGKVHFV